VAFGVDKEASWTLEATAQTSPQTPAKPPPIPVAGPLAEPRSLKQLGVPVEATRAAIPADNLQTPEKIALGGSYSSTGDYRLMEQLLAVHATTRCALSLTEEPSRLASKGASANATRRLF
jgi:hypothetical protein